MKTGRTNAFRKLRGITDKTLSGVLSHHADVLRAEGNALAMLLRERRWLLALHAVEVGAVLWVVLSRA